MLEGLPAIMSRYRLGAYQLPAAEVILLRTLLRLFAHDRSFRWHFVDEAPFDALIVDGTSSDQTAKQAAQQARAVLSLVRAVDPEGPDRLPRPVRADRLQQWLQHVQDDLLESRAMTQFGEDQAPAPAPAPSAESEVAFKLRRWPPVSLLHRDPVRIRMATLMSRRFLKVSELASITGLSMQEVHPFVHNLQLVGLVELKREPVATTSVEPAKETAATKEPNKGFFGKSLIGSIRKRLGL